MKANRGLLRKSKPFIKRCLRLRVVLIAIFILIAVLAIFFILTGNQLPGKVWLPDSSGYRSGDEALFNLPVKSEAVTTKYGKAIRYTTTTDWTDEYKDIKPWTYIYEFRASGPLKPQACPNISGIETLLPSDCDKLGQFEGSPVYSINRRLPSGTTEYFTSVEGVFIYVKMGGDGGQSLDYLKTFKKVSRHEAAKYLAANNDRVKQILADRHAKKAAADRKGSLAYKLLDFTPMLAGVLPQGWELLSGNAKRIEIDGPDAEHPKMVSTNYMNKNNSDQNVGWYVGKLSDFKVGARCGPSPGYSMGYLGCHKVTDTGYYEASLYDERNDFVRYLYYPVGDSLVITNIVVYSHNDKRPIWPTELAKAQDTLTSSAKAVSKNELKGSKFYRLYY